MNFSIHQASHIGNRKYNQDRAAYAYSNDALLLVLADGMGGHLHGEVAAGMTIDTFVESFGQQAQSPLADPQLFLTIPCAVPTSAFWRFRMTRSLAKALRARPAGVLIQDGKMFSAMPATRVFMCCVTARC